MTLAIAREEGSKIGQNCRQIVLKKLPIWERGLSKIQKKNAQVIYVIRDPNLLIVLRT